MSDDILKSYPHAMIMDPDTGKPMMKVYTQGGSGGGGGEVTFPEDFPDLETQSILSQLRSDIQTMNKTIEGLEGHIQDIQTGIMNLNMIANGIADGRTVIKVETQEPNNVEGDAK